MGIFSSKYKTTVGTSVTRVIEDENLPDSIRSGAARSIMLADDQMIENTMDELGNSLGMRVNRMYEYGKRAYAHGIPSDNLIDTKSGEEVLKMVLEEDFGPITIDYQHFGPLNNLHYGWMKMQDQYMYDPATNGYVRNGLHYKLTDMVVVVQEATLAEMENGSLSQWGRSPRGGETHLRPDTGNLASHSPFETDSTAVTDYLRVTGTRQNPAGVIVSDSFTIPVAGVDLVADYHQVKFKNSNGQIHYWLYRSGAGDFPGLDAVYATEHSGSGTYLPWAYFRFDKTSTVKNKNTNEYKTSKKLVNYLGMDYDSIGIAIDENPDIADVEQAIMMMAVPASSVDPMDVRYLFDFFDSMYQRTGGELAGPSWRLDNTRTLLGGLMDSLKNELKAIVIQDKKFKLTLNWRRIVKAKRPGRFGPKGSHEGGYGVNIEQVDGFTINGEPVELKSDVNYHVYRRQITDSMYEEIRVEGLVSKYYIYGDHYETADENEDILLIPLDRAICDTYSIPDREILYARSMHYVFNSRVVTKIKWYQRGAFKVLMVIVAVVIAIWFPPAGAGSLAAALGVTTAVGIAMVSIALSMIISFVAGLALKLFVKLVGGKLALILAVIIAIYAGAKAFNAGSIQGAPFAQELLQLSTGLTNAAGNKFMEDIRDLQYDYEQFMDIIETEQEKLDKAKMELTYNNYLSPEIIFGEKPEDYYNRTVHSGNIGTLAIDAVSSYVDIALTLPKLQQSVGEE